MEELVPNFDDDVPTDDSAEPEDAEVGHLAPPEDVDEPEEAE